MAAWSIQTLCLHGGECLCTFTEDTLGIEVKRKLKYIMEILYDGKVTPHVVIPAFLSFNKANRLIKVTVRSWF